MWRAPKKASAKKAGTGGRDPGPGLEKDWRKGGGKEGGGGGGKGGEGGGGWGGASLGNWEPRSVSFLGTTVFTVTPRVFYSLTPALLSPNSSIG